MRAVTVMLAALAGLAGCIHLPPDVAAVVDRSDPAGVNHFRPAPAPTAAADAGPAARHETAAR